MFILVDNKLNLTLLKKKNVKYLIIYTKYYYIKFVLNKSINVYFNKNCNILELKQNKTLYSKYNATTELSKQTFQITNYFYKKIFFSGKSYKIKKTINNFLLEFNKSHKEVVI